MQCFKRMYVTRNVITLPAHRKARFIYVTATAAFARLFEVVQVTDLPLSFQ